MKKGVVCVKGCDRKFALLHMCTILVHVWGYY